MFNRVEPFYTWFTPIQWTGYILVLDAVLERMRGQSYLNARRREFGYMLVVSVAVWFLFEAYNLHLRNWYYINLPENLAVRLAGYFWSFATIFPGVLLTSEILDELKIFRFARIRPWQPRRRIVNACMAFGLICVTVPVLVPSGVAAYLFAFIWIGFIFLLDPINYKLGQPSLLQALSQGSLEKLLSLFAAGVVCGLLWEFWNYWAGAKWIYTVPYLNSPKIFEMPLFGFLGFLPFAAECFVFWNFALYIWNPNKFFNKPYQFET